MKKFIISVIFCLLMGSFAFAQSKLPQLEKIKQIKLLESTREEVKRIFEDKDEESEGDEYSTDEMYIEITYSDGDCSEESEEDWNVPEGKATEVTVSFGESVNPQDLKIDLSKLERINLFRRDEEDEEDPDDYIYFVNDKTVSYALSDGKIKNIKFIPAEKNYPALCSNRNLREFKSAKDWFLYTITRRPSEEHPRPIANVAELNLSKGELTADCTVADSSKTKGDDYFKVNVETKGESPDPTDVLTYSYTVSAGKIVGTGANVIWDLNGVKPGKYTITAGVDNGCGVCGPTKTEEVIIREPSCPQK